MPIFKGFKNTYKKSEAAVVLQNLLEMQAKSGLFELNPATTANDLIDRVWNDAPHKFDGRFGQRPHKIALAGAALTKAIHSLPFNDTVRNSFCLCLANILSEVEANGSLYPFSNLDFELLSEAASALRANTTDALNSPLGEELVNAFPEFRGDRENSLDAEHSLSTSQVELEFRGHETMEALLYAQIGMCGFGMPVLAERIETDDFSLGYIFGFADMGVFQFTQDRKDQVEALAYMAAFFQRIFGVEGANAFSKALGKQTVSKFVKGRSKGAEELGEWLKTKGKFSPIALAQHFRFQ